MIMAMKMITMLAVKCASVKENIYLSDVPKTASTSTAFVLQVN